MPATARVPLAKLEPEHVGRMLADLTARGTLSPTTVRYVYVVVRIAPGHALRQGKVLRNVATLVDPPAPQPAFETSYRVVERERFLPREVTEMASTVRSTLLEARSCQVLAEIEFIRSRPPTPDARARWAAALDEAKAAAKELRDAVRKHSRRGRCRAAYYSGVASSPGVRVASDPRHAWS